jgi:hypothetical protein
MEPAWAEWDWSGAALSSFGFFFSSFYLDTDFLSSSSSLLSLLILGRLLTTRHLTARSLAHSLSLLFFRCD